MKIRWNSLDCIKGLACIAVVFIHFNFEGNFGIAVKSFCRFGVPVFFFTSGFFFLRNGEMRDENVANKIRHIFKITMGSGIFYLLFTVIINSIVSSNWSIKQYIAQRLLSEKIVKFFLTNDPFVYSHLWFLMGLIYCYLFALIFFEHGKRIGWTSWMAPLLLAAYSCLQEFGGVLSIQRSILIPGTESRVYLFNLFVFRALPFFLFGIVFSRHQEYIIAIPLTKRVAMLLWVCGGIVAIMERFTFGESQFFVGTYLMVAVMCITAIKYPQCNFRLLKHIGRDLSLYVYVLHIAIGKVVDISARAAGLNGSYLFAYGRAFCILCASLLVAEIIYISKKMLRQNGAINVSKV